MRHYWAACVLVTIMGCGDDASEDGTSEDGTSEDGTSEDGGPSPTMHAVFNGTCAAHGDVFTDRFSCDTVEGPAPTSRSGERASAQVVNPDPARLSDPDRQWVADELAACSCICCHHDAGISAYVWSYEFAPVFTDSMSDDRLLGFTNTKPGGGGDDIAPEDNNGFSRVAAGVPTTDGERFIAYITRERARRGLD